MRAGLILIGILVVASGPARAWDALGHMIVGQIAYDHLTPAARAKMDAAMERFNAKEKAQYTPVIAGTWMDDIRGRTREYNPWHYINLPENREGTPLPPETEVNVLWGINKCLGIIEGTDSVEGVDADQAVVMLNHLVGDVHQPLHTTSRNDDLGGNKVKVPNMVDPEFEIFNTDGSLHWFWDVSYRQTTSGDGKVVADFGGPLYSRTNPVAGHIRTLPLVREKASEYIAKFPPETVGKPGTPADWVRESRLIGWDVGYGTLPGGPNSNPVELTSDYVIKARAIAEKRLALAGYRLAYVLNERWQDE